ncbi:unnamed protein product [Acanthoscelides obtectus]|nr:unnamed protein product [Acanthoscelides obtectus]CAK1648856.1 hypothetical protein AOBTE_LOCUS15931 [Acanthoscelides obtectus]
MMFCPN